MITFTVPGEPVAKQRPRKGKTGHFYTPSKTKDAEELIGYEAMSCRTGRFLEPATEPISLTLTFYFEKARRGDLDNYVKTVMDGLNGVCYVDDKQVVRLIAVVKKGDARTEVIVEEER